MPGDAARAPTVDQARGTGRELESAVRIVQQLADNAFDGRWSGTGESHGAERLQRCQHRALILGGDNRYGGCSNAASFPGRSTACTDLQIMSGKERTQVGEIE